MREGHNLNSLDLAGLHLGRNYYFVALIENAL